MINDTLFAIYAKAVAAYRQGQALAARMPGKQDHVPGVLLVFALPAFAAGFVHVAIFAPLFFIEVHQSGLDLVATALLLKQPSCLEPGLARSLFPVLSSSCARPFVLALGLFYGILGITAGLMIITAGLPKILITSNGLLFGLFLTWFLATTVLNLAPAQSLSTYLPRLKVAYLFIAFYLSISLPRLLGGRGYAKEKYESLSSGLFGLAAGFLLATGFGADSVVFTGLLFLGCTFFGTLLTERLVTPFLWAGRAVLGEKYFEYIELDRGYTARTIWRSSISAYQREKGVILVGFGLFALFPFLVGLLYVLILEGVA